MHRQRATGRRVLRRVLATVAGTAVLALTGCGKAESKGAAPAADPASIPAAAPPPTPEPTAPEDVAPAEPEVPRVPTESGALDAGQPTEPFVTTGALSDDVELRDGLATLARERPFAALVQHLKRNRINGKAALIRALWHEEANVRSQAAALFQEAGIAGDAEIARAFERSLRKEPDRDVRALVTKALVELRVPGLVPLLIEVLAKDGEGQVRANAAYALGATGDKSAADALATATTDEETWVRLRSITALRRLGARSAVSALEKALSDPNPLVRKDAVRALQALTGKKYAERPRLQ